MSYRSHEILQGPGYANVRALYKADGYAEEELKRPIIGIANAYNSICPGHIVLRQMAERIREGIQAAGGCQLNLEQLVPVMELQWDTRACVISFRQEK